MTTPQELEAYRTLRALLIARQFPADEAERLAKHGIELQRYYARAGRPVPDLDALAASFEPGQFAGKPYIVNGYSRRFERRNAHV
jgi:hypothetical protein